MVFTGQDVPEFDKIMAMAVQGHTLCPYVPVAGWDVALTNVADDKVRFPYNEIEYSVNGCADIYPEGETAPGTPCEPVPHGLVGDDAGDDTGDAPEVEDTGGASTPSE